MPTQTTPSAAEKPPVPQIDPKEFPTWVIEEDEDFIVFNKPGDVVCHPSKNGAWSSMIGAAKAWKGCEVLHLVSRLDRETSGVLLIAKNRVAARLSQTAFERRHVSKSYLAILSGHLAEPVLVDEPIARDTNSVVAVKHRVCRDMTVARPAVTFFEPLFSGNGFTLARVSPHTGRTHQIRVHARWLGLSVIGDKLYGTDERLYLEFVENGWGQRHEALLEMARHGLHAARLAFKAPDFQRVFTAPLPNDMRVFCLEKLKLPAASLAMLSLQTPPNTI
ncbi:MAG: RluA family pseudouridine synthase [Puniceicoccales bacterium]|jgi:23S rRNA pseudouridine1911/1915/1917 synthase|nr:RluA family pseudouridine synthase [Puniceicoccales bacterium]